jgi:YggT family protein
MTPNVSIITHWYYHLPNLVLAALIYLLIARLLLSLVFASENAALRFLRTITAPVVAAVAAITPRIVPPPIVIVLAIVWLYAARLALFAAITATGARLASS